MTRSSKRQPNELVELHPRVRHWLELLADAGMPHLRPEARELLDHGARYEDIRITTRAAELHLKGVGPDMSKAERRLLEEAPEALRIATLYFVGEDAPKPTFLGPGRGAGYVAWSPGSGVCWRTDMATRAKWGPVGGVQLDLREISDRA